MCQATVTNNNHNDINNKNNDNNMNARVLRLVLCDGCQVSCAWRRLLINQNIGARRRTSICGLGGNSDFICAEFTSAPKLKTYPSPTKLVVQLCGGCLVLVPGYSGQPTISLYAG